MERVLSFLISEEESGSRADQILRRRFSMSRAMLKRIRETPGGLTVNGQPLFMSGRLSAGDKVFLILEPEAAHSNNIPMHPGPLQIVYEDEDLLLLEKDAGIAVEPHASDNEKSLAGVVLWHYRRQGLNFVFRCVNRLDRGTSGLMLIAKNAWAHECLRQQLLHGSFQRQYHALVCGRPHPNQGIIDQPIRRKPGSVLEREVHPGGANSLTAYRCLFSAGAISLLQIRTMSGRTHQIRVHLASIGHPLLGDFLYGREAPELIGRPALHASYLSFEHPLSGERLSFQSVLPSDFLSIIPLDGPNIDI